MSRRSLRHLLDGAASLLFPERCGACEALCRGPFCDPCSETLLPVPPGCPLCGEPGDEALLPILRPRRCVRCRKAPPPFALARASFLHGGALSEAIHRLKYEGREELARPLGALFAGCEPPRADVVAPIPLHPMRLRERGYDQAALLAREAGRRYGLPMRRLLERVRPTRQQVGLDRGRREQNVRAAFRAARDARGLRVCLVDDVLTTGTTAAEATRALLLAGAIRVEVRTLARAM